MISLLRRFKNNNFMQYFLQFLKKIRGLREIKRQGVLYYGVKEKNVDSASDHTFRLTLMVWLLGHGKRINLLKAMKLALVHDLCKVYTGDITPYQGLFSKDDTGHRLAWRWRRLSLQEKHKQHKKKLQKEQAAIEKLTAKLVPGMKKDILASWADYQKMESVEAKFVFQVDRTENLVGALEQFEKNHNFPTQPWWEHADEVVHDKGILDLMEGISKEELRIVKRSRRKKGGKRTEAAL